MSVAVLIFVAIACLKSFSKAVRADPLCMLAMSTLTTTRPGRYAAVLHVPALNVWKPAAHVAAVHALVVVSVQLVQEPVTTELTVANVLQATQVLPDTYCPEGQTTEEHAPNA
jgi:hypothetical protein